MVEVCLPVWRTPVKSRWTMPLNVRNLSFAGIVNLSGEFNSIVVKTLKLFFLLLLQGCPFKLKIKQGRQDSLSVQIVWAYSRPRIKVKRSGSWPGWQSIVHTGFNLSEWKSARHERPGRGLWEGNNSSTWAALQRCRGPSYLTLISRR